MASSHPVILIHAATWCGACKHFTGADNMSKLTRLIQSINPSTEVKIIYHNNFKDTNKKEEYPPIDYIPGFPMLMITDSTNCSRSGTMNKVHILGYKWNGKALVRGEDESPEAFIKRVLKPGNLSPNGNKPIINEVTKPNQSIGINGKTNRRERRFILIGSSND